MRGSHGLGSLLLSLCCALLWLTLIPPLACAFNEFQRLVAGDGLANDNFGFSADISGNFAIVGSWRDDEGATDSGSAYIFRNPGSGTWSQVDKLVASDAAESDRFGASVALGGNVAIAGSPFDNWGRGSAYLFRDNGGNNWTQFDKLEADDGAGGVEFGGSVAISGNLAIVGAPKDRGTVGAAYVFHDNGLGDWQQIAKLTASDGAVGAEFGNSVAISGNVALVGAHFDSESGGAAGAAYLFQFNGTSWSPLQKLLPTDPAVNKQFGASVAIDGNEALVGAVGDSTAGVLSGAAYVFQQTSPSLWTEVDKLTPFDGAANDQFGFSVAYEGDTAVIGAYQDSIGAATTAGSAYLFRDNLHNNWNQIGKLWASDAAAGDSLGNAVAISDNKVLVGAPKAGNTTDSGAGYLFNLPAASFGDYNHNGRVDAADYVLWRNMAGQTGAGLAADGNGDSFVNQGDYLLWRENFGRVIIVPPFGAIVAVPEPGASALLLFAALFALSRKRN